MEMDWGKRDTGNCGGSEEAPCLASAGREAPCKPSLQASLMPQE